MNVTIVGTGYVGLVTGTCLAEVGNQVVCVDADIEKIARLNNGEIPIFEPGLETLVRKNFQAGRLEFTDSTARGVEHGEIIFIAVGTPPGEDGSADLSHVLAVAGEIGRCMTDPRIIVNKSTVPVGTADRVRETIGGVLSQRNSDVAFAVVSNPEFLKEGAAVEDFMKPDRIIIGADSEDALDAMRRLYAPFNRNHERVIEMDVRSAELTKYAANALLATKISFMNEMANLAERLEADIEQVRVGIGADPRIGYHFIYPGCGYGGSCFPKDVQALFRTARENDYPARILAAVEAVNADQKLVPFGKIAAHFNDKIEGRKFCIWGLAFKPNTDDMREAPSLTVIRQLTGAGGRVTGYDPVAGPQADMMLADVKGFSVAEDPYAGLEGADALVVLTEWAEFRSPDFSRIKNLMREPVIVDGRNIFDPGELRRQGFVYYGIGRR